MTEPNRPPAAPEASSSAEGFAAQSSAHPLRSLLWFVVRLGISAALLVWLFTKEVDFGKFLEAVSTSRQELLLIGAVFILLAILLGTLRWMVLVRAIGEPISYAAALKLCLIGMFSNNFLPGLTGGDFVRAFLVTRGRESKVSSFLSVFVDRVIGLVMLSSLAAVTVLFHLDRPEFRGTAIGIYALLAVFFVGVLVYFNPWLRRSRLFEWIKSRLPFRSLLKKADESFYLYRRRRRAIAQACGIALVVHLSSVVGYACYGEALGIKGLGWGHYLTYLPVILIISAIPISVGGFGVGEKAAIGLFGLAGVLPEHAIALSLLYRLTNVLFSLPGAVLLIRLRLQRRREVSLAQQEGR